MIANLGRIAALQSLPPDGLARLAGLARQRTFAAGEVLMRQGDPSESIQFIVRGRVRVEREFPNQAEPLLLAELGVGESIGERGVLYCEPRYADVTAVEDTETIELDTAALALIGLRYPDVGQSLMRIINQRQHATARRQQQAQRGEDERPG